MERYPSEELFDLQTLIACPEGIGPIPRQIPGLGFFPGGRGVYQEPGSKALPRFPRQGVMVLGQDFDKVEGFADSLKRGEEERAVATWGNLLPLLDSCRLPLAACFFTNAYVGLRKSDINYGPGAGTRSPAFRASCEQFFVQQLAAQQPKLILALGLEVALFLSRCSPNFAAWRVDTLKTIDSSGAALIEGAQVGPHTIAATVVLVHPSFRPANVGRRRFRGAVGETAEQLLICTGAGIAGGFSDFCRLTPACRGDAPRAARA